MIKWLLTLLLALVERLPAPQDDTGADQRRDEMAHAAVDGDIGSGAQAHATYLARNLGRSEVAGLRVHEEDQSLPGATAEGAAAAKRSHVASGDQSAAPMIDGAALAKIIGTAGEQNGAVYKITIGRKDRTATSLPWPGRLKATLPSAAMSGGAISSGPRRTAKKAALPWPAPPLPPRQERANERRRIPVPSSSRAPPHANGNRGSRKRMLGA